MLAWQRLQVVLLSLAQLVHLGLRQALVPLVLLLLPRRLVPDWLQVLVLLALLLFPRRLVPDGLQVLVLLLSLAQLAHRAWQRQQVLLPSLLSASRQG